ncbi:hypothetical protein BDQ12DRAFT_706297 [Crucibulum laeve]|uniref:BHLH domain-containing protein n=1 Tax=Crucibulum laeve TaxID=68775 RepID=A0A5C3LUE0_9AGAR|nr:hypothetical protein BDQ12DRAFT_706297 [Crucibulum laeve]
MAPATPAAQDAALAQQAPQQPSQAPTALPPNLNGVDLSHVHLANLDQNQIMQLLRNLPVFSKPQLESKEDAAQTLSNLSQQSAFQLPVHYGATPAGGASGLPGINDPGPSSHPRGPPNLGQLSAVAMQAAPASRSEGQQQDQQQQQQQQQQQDQEANNEMKEASPSASTGAPTSSGGRARGGRSAAMGSDEWSRQRKDNHKEVERRRRGNINEGINELGRIVPNGSGEKAKGAILSRAVQYIHHLKENEARNIEKWTLEKLLMDQAMGDLQAQLEEVKRMWEEERMARQRLDNELEAIRGVQGQGQGKEESNKRRSEEGDKEEERDGKRQRTE